MSKAEDNRALDRLTRKMLTPPFDPEAFVEPKPGSYEKFTEMAEEIRSSGDEEAVKHQERGSALWDSIGKKDND